jgi:hypothetical protein
MSEFLTSNRKLPMKIIGQKQDLTGDSRLLKYDNALLFDGSPMLQGNTVQMIGNYYRQTSSNTRPANTQIFNLKEKTT